MGSLVGCQGIKNEIRMIGSAYTLEWVKRVRDNLIEVQKIATGMLLIQRLVVGASAPGERSFREGSATMGV